MYGYFKKLCVWASYSVHGVHSRVLKRILRERVENRFCRALMNVEEL